MVPTNDKNHQEALKEIVDKAKLSFREKYQDCENKFDTVVQALQRENELQKNAFEKGLVLRKYLNI